MSTALPLIAIYLNNKFYLNANSSFKVICRTRYRMEGQSGDYMHLIKKRMGYRVNKYASPTALSLILVETTCSIFSALKIRQKAISLQNNFI